MQQSPSATIVPNSSARLVSAKTLRQWCAPEIILVITDLCDDVILMPHLINQARHSTAKIILAHPVTSADVQHRCQSSVGESSTSSAQQARTALERIARRLRWLGFRCEALVLSGQPEVEIPSLIRGLSIHRVILAMEDNPESSLRQTSTTAEKVLRAMEIPTCVVGRCVSPSNAASTRSVTLAVSLDSDCEVPLGFACRLAQEHHARLTIFHASGPANECGEHFVQSPQTLAARLPSPTWREAELFCPTQITVKPGDPAEEILKHCATTRQDMLILCSAAKTFSGQKWRDSVTYRVLHGAQCPVFVVGRRTDTWMAGNLATSLPQRISAYSERSLENLRKEELAAICKPGARSIF